jgi:hypothetical protein
MLSRVAFTQPALACADCSAKLIFARPIDEAVVSGRGGSPMMPLARLGARRRVLTPPAEAAVDILDRPRPFVAAAVGRYPVVAQSSPDPGSQRRRESGVEESWHWRASGAVSDRGFQALGRRSYP